MPERFELRNETAASVTVAVTIEADDRTVLDESYSVPGNGGASKPWPKVEATTYTVSAETATDDSAFTFDLSDWKERNTPLVVLTKNGVEVFVGE
ncbi:MULTISPECIES: hypothetical protein [Halorussus]|uniref:hypothetical protein n=1 Tax=Halorussus TaxID=1070314 RepID=UPI0020A01AE9|nr:hypothetical protein [Halorussus vallis]USZ77758.1 hypothetical protein NGM07_21490 [Halorussus vallis]